MTKQHFNIEEILGFAWSKTKQHAWFLVCSFMIYTVIASAVRLVPMVETLVQLAIVLSLLSMSLIIVRNENFNFSDLFNRLRSPHLVIKFLALTAIYVFAVMIFVMPFFGAVSVSSAAIFLGLTTVTWKLVLAIITTTIMLLPGIYIAVRFKFYPYILLENENLSIQDVIKNTEKLTRDVFWELLWFFVVIMVINILGFFAFFVGLFLTVPTSVFALAHLYRKLQVHIH